MLLLFADLMYVRTAGSALVDFFLPTKNMAALE